LIVSQEPEKREPAEMCIHNLMNGIERSLSLKNRDKFTQNIATFRRDINECLKASSTSINLNLNQQSQLQNLNTIPNQQSVQKPVMLTV
jgi:hypothetical protein